MNPNHYQDLIYADVSPEADGTHFTEVCLKALAQAEAGREIPLTDIGDDDDVVIIGRGVVRWVPGRRALGADFEILPERLAAMRGICDIKWGMKILSADKFMQGGKIGMAVTSVMPRSLRFFVGLKGFRP
jgi:hypothetical protein